VSWWTTRCYGRGNSSLHTGCVICRWIVRDGWQQNRKKSHLECTVMVLPEVSRDGMKICPARSKAKTNPMFLY